MLDSKVFQGDLLLDLGVVQIDRQERLELLAYVLRVDEVGPLDHVRFRFTDLSLDEGLDRLLTLGTLKRNPGVSGVVQLVLLELEGTRFTHRSHQHGETVGRWLLLVHPGQVLL